MPRPLLWHIVRHAPAGDQKLQEAPDVPRKIVAILPAKTDVQVRALAHAPPIPLEIVAEVELGNVGIDRASTFLSRSQPEFNFLGCDDRFSKPGIQQPRDRAEVAAG